MEIPKKVNGKECVENLINAMASYNGAHLSLNHIFKPSIFKPSDVEYAIGFAASMILMSQSLVDMAKEFGINAELSEKEHVILVDGKICTPSMKDKRHGTT